MTPSSPVALSSLISDHPQPRWTLAHVAQAMGGVIHWPNAQTQRDPALGIQAIITDSRALLPGCLFVALRGEKFDGHDFIAQAIAGGAVAVVVDEAGERQFQSAWASLSAPRLVVRDTLYALGDMARDVRAERRHDLVVGITGSVGKTTTKELTAAALSARSPVHRTRGNLNNHVGVPLTLFEWRPDQHTAVIEMGMNALGEIARLSQICAPNVGIITKVAPAHLEQLGSLENIARAKGELFAGLARDAVAIVNNDDPMVRSICVPLLHPRQRVMRFGSDPSCDAYVRACAPMTRDHVVGLNVTMVLLGETVTFWLPMMGAHNGMNAAAAALAARVLGWSAAEIGEGLAHTEMPDGRLRVFWLAARGMHVIDDTYNANPSSMAAALRTLHDVAPDGTARRVAILGTMLALGAESATLHAQIGRVVAECGVHCLIAVGEHGEAMAQAARTMGVMASAYGDVEEAMPHIHKGVQTGDWILVKGSRGMQMERVVKSLMEKDAQGGQR